MSLKKEDVDIFEYKMDEDDIQTLADWIAYFDVKYKRHQPPHPTCQGTC